MIYDGRFTIYDGGMNPSHDDLANLMAKITAAGWATQSGIIGSRGNVQFTEHGLAMMRELSMGNFQVAAELGDLPDAEILLLMSLIKEFASGRAAS